MVTPERAQELEPLQESLGYRFKSLWLLNKALTHKSYVNEKAENIKNNERFEFLGDSVLDLVVSDYLIENYQDFTEGRMSKIRAAVVNESCLADLARTLDLGKYLLLGKGEDLSGGREKNSLLANAFEAVSGALYRDGTLEQSCDVLIPLLKERITHFSESYEFRDFKSGLQEYTQNHWNSIPSYEVVGEFGPDHNKEFEVRVKVHNGMKGTGTGRTKKEAEQAAARDALDQLKVQSG